MWKLRSQTSFDQSWSAEQKVSARKYVTAQGGQIRAKRVCFALYWRALCFVSMWATQCKNRTNQSKRCVMVDINARKRDLWRSAGIRRAPHWGTQWYILYKQLLLVHLNKHTHIDYDKVNRCLARYSPRATTTNWPTNRAPKKPAWPGPNWTKMPILGRIWSF